MLLEQLMFLDYPCRTCVHNKEPIDAISSRTAHNTLSRWYCAMDCSQPVSIGLYGVTSQKVGVDICPLYSHEEWTL